MAEDDDKSGFRSGSVPVPDPTILTTEQLYRALGNLRELIETRLEGMDKAVELLRMSAGSYADINVHNAMRELLLERIMRSDTVTLEHFARIETQFIELDKRTSQLKIASDTAIAAAMAAAEKAVGENNRSFSLAVAKSETSTGEALKNLGEMFRTEVRATNDKVSVLASRQDRNDGSSAGMWAMGAAIIAVVSLLLAGYSTFHGSSAVQPTVTYVPAPTAVPAPITVPAVPR